MRTLLIATDFSENSRKAAVYGYALARQLQARILLCHVMNVPAEIPQTGMIAWPAAVYEDMLQNSTDELDKLKTRLIAEGGPGAYQPEITCIHEAGLVADVVSDKARAGRADLILMGTHGNDGLTTLMIGNHARKMIDAVTVPLLLVPPDVTARPLKRIAFASDFKHPDKDIRAIHELLDVIGSLDVELVLAHIDRDDEDPEYMAILENLLQDLLSGLPHRKTSCEVVKSDHVEDGLNWLIRQAHIDLIAFAHRDRGFLDRLFNGSHTQKAAGKLPIPLLVIKEK